MRASLFSLSLFLCLCVCVMVVRHGSATSFVLEQQARHECRTQISSTEHTTQAHMLTTHATHTIKTSAHAIHRSPHGSADGAVLKMLSQRCDSRIQFRIITRTALIKCRLFLKSRQIKIFLPSSEVAKLNSDQNKVIYERLRTETKISLRFQYTSPRATNNNNKKK